MGTKDTNLTGKRVALKDARDNLITGIVHGPNKSSTLPGTNTLAPGLWTVNPEGEEKGMGFYLRATEELTVLN
jgi:hypothetical protein